MSLSSTNSPPSLNATGCDRWCCMLATAALQTSRLQQVRLQWAPMIGVLVTHSSPSSSCGHQWSASTFLFRSSQLKMVNLEVNTTFREKGSLKPVLNKTYQQFIHLKQELDQSNHNITFSRSMLMLRAEQWESNLLIWAHLLNTFPRINHHHIKHKKRQIFLLHFQSNSNHKSKKIDTWNLSYLSLSLNQNYF